MQIHITGRHLRLTQPLRTYVEQKVRKAQKYFSHLIWAQVVLSVEKKAHQAEIVIHASGQTFRALARGLDLYSAIDLASDKADTQLKKYKERLRSHHKTKAAAAVALEPATIEPAELRFSVTKQAVAPISREEAANEMDRLGHQFRLFLDQSTGHMSVVYRRVDESYGLLQAVRKNGK